MWYDSVMVVVVVVVVVGVGVGVGVVGVVGVGVKLVIPASAVTCPTRQCMMSICSRF